MENEILFELNKKEDIDIELIVDSMKKQTKQFSIIESLYGFIITNKTNQELISYLKEKYNNNVLNIITYIDRDDNLDINLFKKSIKNRNWGLELNRVDFNNSIKVDVVYEILCNYNNKSVVDILSFVNVVEGREIISLTEEKDDSLLFASLTTTNEPHHSFLAELRNRIDAILLTSIPQSDDFKETVKVIKECPLALALSKSESNFKLKERDLVIEICTTKGFDDLKIVLMSRSDFSVKKQDEPVIFAIGFLNDIDKYNTLVDIDVYGSCYTNHDLDIIYDKINTYGLESYSVINFKAPSLDKVNIKSQFNKITRDFSSDYKKVRKNILSRYEDKDDVSVPKTIEEFIKGIDIENVYMSLVNLS